MPFLLIFAYPGAITPMGAMSPTGATTRTGVRSTRKSWHATRADGYTAVSNLVIWLTHREEDYEKHWPWELKDIEVGTCGRFSTRLEHNSARLSPQYPRHPSPPPPPKAFLYLFRKIRPTSGLRLN